MAQSIHLGCKNIMLLALILWLGLLPLSSTRVVAPPPADLLLSNFIRLDNIFPSIQNVTAEHDQLKQRALDQASITKGRRLDCLMSATIAHAQQINGGTPVESSFEEIFILAFEEEGWQAKDVKPKYDSSGIQQNLEIIIPGGDPVQTVYSYYTNQNSGVRGDDAQQDIIPSGAVFGNGINAPAGLIIADTNRSPKYASAGGLPANMLSRIAQWSQAAFGSWESLAAAADASVDSLNYVIRSWVTNTGTQDQVIEAFRGIGLDQIPNLAGRQVFGRMSTNQAEVDGFYAMLGTPNGASTGYLLATHKMKLGIKRVSQIAVWNHPTAAPLGLERDLFKINMLFTFEDVANPTDVTPDPPTRRHTLNLEM